MISRRAATGIGAVLCLLLALVVARFPDNPLTRQAQGYAAGVATTAAGTYVTLRTLNAVLSTAQEIEVGMSLIASGSAQPLKVLEPIDDTIERIASLVFGIMVSTGVIAIALGPMSAIGFGLLALALAVAALRDRPLTGMSRRFMWYGIFLGLALPLALTLSAPLAGFLTEAAYETHSATVAEITARVGGAQMIEDGGSDMGLREFRQMALNVWNRADDLIGALVAIFGIYVFRIFLLPVLMIVGLFLAARSLARSPT